MINRLTADALDSASFVERVKGLQNAEASKLLEQVQALEDGPEIAYHPASYGETRTERRARERAERKAALRAAKVKI